MKKEDIETKLSSMDLPQPGNIPHQKELKIPLLSYKRSSRVGLWLLVVPAIVAVTILLKYELGLSSPFLDILQSFFAAIDGNSFFTYLIPFIFIGLPLLVMIVNLLAFCHFTVVEERKELVVTIKYRPLNITIFLFSMLVIVFFLLPDKLSF